MRYWGPKGPLWPFTQGTDSVPCQPERACPREVSEEAYKEYVAQGHGDQSHARLLERGGFGSVEMAIFLYQRIKRLESQSDAASVKAAE